MRTDQNENLKLFTIDDIKKAIELARCVTEVEERVYHDTYSVEHIIDTILTDRKKNIN